MSIPTIDDVQQYLSQIQDASVEATTLEAILPRAIAIVLRAIGHELGIANFTFEASPAASPKRYTAHGGFVRLNPYLGAVTSVEYSTDETTWTALDPSSYEVQDSILILHFCYRAPLALRVTAPWGYGDCPDDIAEVILELTVNLWRAKETGGFITQVGENGSSYQKTVSGLTKLQLSMIQAYTNQYRKIII